MGLARTEAHFRARESAVLATREVAPMLLVLLAPAAFVLALAIHGTELGSPAFVPAASPTPGPTDGFRFEQVGVGVKRLVNDGTGHRPGDRGFLFKPDPEIIAFELDGAVLTCCEDPDLFFGDGVTSRLLRLGDDEPLNRWDDSGLGLRDAASMIVTPTGQVWVNGPRLASLGPSGWTVHERRSGTGGLAAGPDGSVWSDASSGGRLRIVHAFEGGTQSFGPGSGLPPRTTAWGVNVTGIAATPDDHAWVGVGAPRAGREGGLLHFDGQRWRIVRPLGRGIDASVDGLSVAPDGTLWAYLSRETHPRPNGKTTRTYLASLGDSGWTVLGERDGVPQLGHRARLVRPSPLMAAGPSGTVWLAPASADGCRQLVAYRNGETDSPLDRAACVEELKVAPDGSAWVVVAWSTARGAERWFTELFVVDI